MNKEELKKSVMDSHKQARSNPIVVIKTINGVETIEVMGMGGENVNPQKVTEAIAKLKSVTNK